MHAVEQARVKRSKEILIMTNSRMMAQFGCILGESPSLINAMYQANRRHHDEVLRAVEQGV